MRYCPMCGDEFLDSVSRCDDCNAELVDEARWAEIVQEQKQEDQEFFVKVCNVENQFEADVVKNALDQEEIPALVRSFTDTSFDGLFIPQKGWGIILVPEEFRKRAIEVIEAVTSSDA